MSHFVVDSENPNTLASIPSGMRPGFGLSSSFLVVELAFALFGCTTAATTATSVAPKEASSCSVEMRVESTDVSAPAAHPSAAAMVDLGRKACDEPRTVVIARSASGHAGQAGGYFVSMEIAGTAEHPIVTSDVATFSGEADATAAARAAEVMLRNLPRPREGAGSERPPVNPSSTPRKAHAAPAGQWTEIASGTWPDASPYRVLVRVTPNT